MMIRAGHPNFGQHGVSTDSWTRRGKFLILVLKRQMLVLVVPNMNIHSCHVGTWVTLARRDLHFIKAQAKSQIKSKNLVRD
jgi:hypothetical protein